MHVLQTLVRDAIVGGEIPVVIVNRGGGGGDDGTGGGGRLAAALADEGPAVHLELRELVGWQDHGLVQQFGHPEVDGEPGGVVGRAVEAQPSTGRGCRHPARLQLGHSGEVSAGQQRKYY